MKKIIGSVLLLLCSTFLFAAESLTLEDIVSIPDVKNVRLAPNGQHIAYLTRVNTKTHQGVLVKMYNTKTNEFKKLAYSSNDKYVITSIFWGNNDTLLMKAKFPKKENGLLYYESRLLKVNINTGALERVLKRNVFKRMLYFPNVLNKVVDTLPDDDDYILMSLGGYINTLGDAVLRIPITDKGKYKTIQNAKTDIIRWITDAKHNVRIGIHREETTYTIKEKLSNGKFKDLWSYEAFSPETIRPLGFGADNNTLYVKALYKGKNAIYKVDLTDPDLKKELVYNRKNYDVSGRLRRSKETNEIVGIGNYYWDKDYKSLMDSIDAILTETNNTILDVSKDGNKYILLSRNDNQPGMYYVGDKKKRTLQVFAYRHQKLAPDLLSKKTKVKYKARDGLEIEGFITIPRGLKDKNLPTIIFPHGGPISYDNGSYDYWTQFFANKGYAVFQMNFRGSSGYGYDFMKQGIASWGQAMQDDVEDGTRWLISEGIADKNKICIAGASYGGYAALMGAIKTPDLYQCIISFAGVTDVEQLVKSSRKFVGYDTVKKQIGSDYSKLWEVSPLKHASKITKPVLLIHGTKDRTVLADQSEDMFDELKDEKKVVQYIELEEGDHYLSNNDHRLKTFRAMDKFLDKYLPVK